jgi:hypothetical protein
LAVASAARRWRRQHGGSVAACGVSVAVAAGLAAAAAVWRHRGVSGGSSTAGNAAAARRQWWWRWQIHDNKGAAAAFYYTQQSTGLWLLALPVTWLPVAGIASVRICDTTPASKKSSSSPREASVCDSLSVIPSVRAKRGI